MYLFSICEVFSILINFLFFSNFSMIVKRYIHFFSVETMCQNFFKQYFCFFANDTKFCQYRVLRETKGQSDSPYQCEGVFQCAAKICAIVFSARTLLSHCVFCASQNEWQLYRISHHKNKLPGAVPRCAS